MVLGALAPVIVGYLVVIPHHNPRQRTVCGLQVLIGAVAAEADAVILQRDNFVRRVVQAHWAIAGVFALRILVDIVAQEDHVIQLVRATALGNIAIGIEESGLPVGTASHAEGELFRGGAQRRGGLGAADGRVLILRLKAEEVHGLRL